MLEFIILGTLYNKSLTGYDIRKCIESGIGMFYKASYGSIYPLLQRLYEQSYVTFEEMSDAKRRQKIYTITKEGKIYFKNWLTEVRDEPKVESFMAKVFFLDLVEEQIALNQLTQFEQLVRRYLEELYQEREQYMLLPHQENFYYKLSTLYYGVAKLQSLLGWCEVVKKRQSLEKIVITEVTK